MYANESCSPLLVVSRRPIDRLRLKTFPAGAGSIRPRKRPRSGARAALLFLLFFSTAGLNNSLFGQAFVNGSITVTVNDTSGAPVPNASLVLTNLETSTRLNSTSDESGVGRFLNLPPGSYRLQAEHAGFQQVTQTPIVVEINNTVRIALTLQVGQMTQEIQVTAQTPLLQPETSSLGQVVQQRESNELPLNGRNPIALVALVPGVIPQASAGQNPVAGNSFAPGNFQINGGAANQSAAFWDGIPMNATGYNNELAIVPTQDALQEFKVQTSNLPAEYDRFAGGIVSFITKSGSNSFHGELYEYLRNKVLNANNFFNNRTNIANPQFTQNQFGGNLGGPVVKNKLFFFASYDGFRLRQGLPYLVTVPTTQERSGDFSNLRDAKGNPVTIYDPTTTLQVGNTYTRQPFPGNVIPAGSIDPTARIIEKYWPLPNLPGVPFTSANNWAGNESSGGNMNEYIARVDYNVSERQRLFVRYTYEGWFKAADNVFGTGVVIQQNGGTAAAGQGPNDNLNQQIALDDTIVFSPHLVGDFEVGYLRTKLIVTPSTAGLDLSTLGPGWANLQNQVNTPSAPGINMSQITGWTSATGLVIKDYTDDYNFLPSLSWTIGHHSLKFGGEYRLSRVNYGQVGGASGNFTFNSNFTSSSPVSSIGGFDFASYLLGDAASGTIQSINFPASQKFYAAGYAQDNWQVTPRLTLNIGLRYSYDSAFTERHNLISTFLQNAPNPLASQTGVPATGQLALVNTPQRPGRTGFDAYPRQFAPRIGFGYQLNTKTILRAAYGIFWLPNILTYGPYTPVANPVNQYSSTMISTLNGGITPYNRLSNPFPNGIIQAPGRSPDLNSLYYGLAPQVSIPNNPYAYVQQWNFDIQRELPGKVFLDAAYAGAKGTHLPIAGYQVDQLNPQFLSMGSALLSQLPNPFYNLNPPFHGTLSGPTISVGQLLSPYPQYNGLSINPLNVGVSTYQSFQLKAQRNFSSGQTILLAYTVSKNLNDGAETQTTWLNTTAGIQNWYNLAGEKALTSFDVPQRMILSYVLDLPFGRGKKFLAGAHGLAGALVSGWGMDAIWTAQKGTPLFLTTATNLTGALHSGSRPNFNGSLCPNGAGTSGSTTQRIDQGWFNAACFTQPAPFTFGNVSRTSGNLRTDGTNTIDAALFKNMHVIKEAIILQLRAEGFNLFNTPVFGRPNTTLGSVGFSTVSSQANNPRLIQLGLKLSF